MVTLRERLGNMNTGGAQDSPSQPKHVHGTSEADHLIAEVDVHLVVWTGSSHLQDEVEMAGHGYDIGSYSMDSHYCHDLAKDSLLASGAPNSATCLLQQHVPRAKERDST